MSALASIVFMIGAAVAVVLLCLLVLTMMFPKLCIWPTPGEGSWQSYVFWPLFRGLNVLCFATALPALIPSRSATSRPARSHSSAAAQAPTSR